MSNKNKKYPEIKTGVIGAGSMGRHHIRILSELTNLCGVSDIDEPQGQAISQKYSTVYFKNYEDLIDRADFLVVAVPTFLHKEIGEKVLEAGKDILIEKPLAKTVAESSVLIAKAKEQNSQLSVGHIERFNDTIIHAKSKLDSGLWGRPLNFSATRYSPFPKRISDVGVLFDLTIHDVDIICHLAESKALSVFASGNKSKNDKHEDNISLIVNFENGCRGLCQTSWLTPVKLRSLEITTDTHFVLINHMTKEIEIFENKENLAVSSNNDNYIHKKYILEATDSLENELIGSLEKIKTGNGMFVSGEEAMKAIRIVEAGKHSMLTGKVVNL